MYRDRLLKLLMMGLVGFCIGFVLYTTQLASETDGIALKLLFAVIFAGVPYGWWFSFKVFSFMLEGSLYAVILGLVLRLIFSVVVGCITYPFVFLYTLVRAILEIKEERAVGG